MRQMLAVMLALMMASFAFAASGSAQDYQEDELVSVYAAEDASASAETLAGVEAVAGETDAEIQEEIGISAEQRAEIRAALGREGLGPYVRVLQLQKRLTERIIRAESIVGRISADAEVTAELVAVIDEMKAFQGSLDPEGTDQEAYVEAVADAKALVTKFRETVQASTTVEQRAELRAELGKVDPTRRREYVALKEREEKARKFANRVAFRERFRALAEEVEDADRENEKLLTVKTRVEQLRLLRHQAINVSLTVEQKQKLQADWVARRQEFLQDKENLPVLNARARLAFEAQEIRKALVAMKADGEDTADLQAQLDAIHAEIRAIQPGVTANAEARQKATVIDARLNNLRANDAIERGLAKLEENRRFQAIISGSGSADSTARRAEIRQRTDASASATADSGTDDDGSSTEAEAETSVEASVRIGGGSE